MIHHNVLKAQFKNGTAPLGSSHVISSTHKSALQEIPLPQLSDAQIHRAQAFNVCTVQKIH